MEKKSQVDDSISFSDDPSHGPDSSAGKNKTSIQNQRESEVSAISSERIQSTQQTSSRSDLSSEAGQPVNEDRKDSDTSRAEVGLGEPTKMGSSLHDQLKTLPSSSKENDDVVQLNSVDSTDTKPCQSSNENTAQKKSCTRQDGSGYSHPSEGSSCVLQEPDSSHMSSKADTLVDGMSSKHRCVFDLNEGMEAHGAEGSQQFFHELKSSVDDVSSSEPIPVVAKVGVPIGLPKKPLQFGGELGWRRSANTSAFRSTISKNSDRENGASGSRPSLASQGIDLNIAATMDSELHADENYVDVSAKQTRRFPLDLNYRGENGENHHKQGASEFDLNFNPTIEDTRKNDSQIGENRQMSKNYITTGSTTGPRGNVNQPIPDTTRPSYWVDLSAMRGFNHLQSQPFLVAAPTAEQVRMVVPIQSEISFLPHAPSGLHIDKIHNLSPTFYPPTMLPQLNNQHPAPSVIPHLSGSVIAAYPGALHVLDGPQVLYPTAYTTNLRPTVVQNGGIALLENGGRGVSNVEFLVPTRNAVFDERMKPLERVALPPSSAKRREPDGGWDYSQVSYRPMASWN